MNSFEKLNIYVFRIYMCLWLRLAPFFLFGPSFCRLCGGGERAAGRGFADRDLVFFLGGEFFFRLGLGCAGEELSTVRKGFPILDC